MCVFAENTAVGWFEGANKKIDSDLRVENAWTGQSDRPARRATISKSSKQLYTVSRVSHRQLFSREVLAQAHGANNLFHTVITNPSTDLDRTMCQLLRCKQSSNQESDYLLLMRTRAAAFSSGEPSDV